MFTNVSWTTNATKLQAYFVFPFKMLSKIITTIKSSDYSVIVFLIINKRIHRRHSFLVESVKRQECMDTLSNTL